MRTLKHHTAFGHRAAAHTVLSEVCRPSHCSRQAKLSRYQCCSVDAGALSNDRLLCFQPVCMWLSAGFACSSPLGKPATSICHTGRFQETPRVSEEVQWAMGLVPRRVREAGDPLEGPPPTAHCCATAASFRALRCHCWHGFPRVKVRRLVHSCYILL